jgi:negative regulator of genetic competence, sporulation and motility
LDTRGDAAGVVSAEQEEQRNRERAQKEADLEEREMEYIRQVDAKEIDEEKFWELVNELDMERAIAESVAEGPATMQVTTQDEEVGESEREESAEEEPAAAEVVVESSTVGKGKQKAAPARAKVYAETGEPVSNLLNHRQHALMQSLTVRPVFHAEDEADVHHHPKRTALQEVPDQQELMHLEREESRGRRGGGVYYAQEVEGGVGNAGQGVVEQGRGAGGGAA